MSKMLKKAEEKLIPRDIDYKLIPNLSAEAAEKLEKLRPMSIGQVTRISGVSPADQCALLFYLQKKVKSNDRTVIDK
jgi:tRNA uridine 5-carboxymethylaminomethyl modification enzyme